MKIKIGLLLGIFAFAISFSSCKKDEDKVIPDITGTSYGIYKISYSAMGVSDSYDVSSTDEDYLIWTFEEGGVLKENDIEVGTWSQDGENVTIVNDLITYECKVSGNEMTAEFDFIYTFTYYLRKI